MKRLLSSERNAWRPQTGAVWCTCVSVKMLVSGPAGHRGDGHRGSGGTEAAGAAGLQAGS